MVALKGVNEEEIGDMLRWCAAAGHDLTLIETMPIGDTGEERVRRYLPLDEVRRRLEREFALIPSLARTGGPARYYEVGGTAIRLGLITPLTGNFCAGCNRIRVDRHRHRLWLPRPRPEGRASGRAPGGRPCGGRCRARRLARRQARGP